MEITYVAALYETTTLVINGSVLADGYVKVTLNNIVYDIAVTSGQDATAAATTIRNTVFTGWTTSGTGTTIIFTSNTIGAKSATLFANSIATAEVDILTITTPANADSNVTVTLNGTAFTVALLSTDNTTDLVATKLRAASYSGWIVSGTGSNVIFTSNTLGTLTTAPAFDPLTSGCVGSFNKVAGITSTGVTNTLTRTVIGTQKFDTRTIYW